MISIALCLQPVAHAQDEEPRIEHAPADGAPAEEPAKAPTDINVEGVPTETVEASQAVSEVEKSVRQLEKDTEKGIPAEFTIKFGDTHDWLRLTSGEWLKGDLHWMREKKVEFDSDKLKLLTFDWSKVDQLHSPRINTYVFEGRIDVVGRAVITKEDVIIDTTEGVKTFPRSELLTILEGGRRERNWWSTRLGLGFSANAGNTNQGSLTVLWDLVRSDPRTRSALGYDGTFGYVGGKQNVNRHLGSVDVVIYVSKRFFVTPAIAQFLYDKFQNLKFRVTPAAGGGVHIIDTNEVEWDFGSALGYQYVRFLSAAAGVENPQNNAFIMLRTRADFDITSDIKLKIDWRTNLAYTDIGSTNHVGSAEFSVEVGDDLFDFETSFLFLRTESPPPRANGTVPRKNDYQLVFSIALKIG